MAMYVHVEKNEDIPESELETADPFELVMSGRVNLVHSECVGGKMTVEPVGDAAVAFVCGKCEARQELERTETVDALRRVLLYEEYGWAGDAGLLPS